MFAAHNDNKYARWDGSRAYPPVVAPLKELFFDFGTCIFHPPLGGAIEHSMAAVTGLLAAAFRQNPQQYSCLYYNARDVRIQIHKLLRYGTLADKTCQKVGLCCISCSAYQELGPYFPYILRA